MDDKVFCESVSNELVRQITADVIQHTKIPVLEMAEAAQAAQAASTNALLRALADDVKHMVDAIQHLREVCISYEKESAVLMRKLTAPDIVFTGPAAQDDTDPVADMLGGVC